MTDVYKQKLIIHLPLPACLSFCLALCVYLFFNENYIKNMSSHLSTRYNSRITLKILFNIESYLFISHTIPSFSVIFSAYAYEVHLKNIECNMYFFFS